VTVVTAAAQRLLLYTNTAQGGEVGISESAAAAAGALGLSKVSAGCHKLLAETLPSYCPLLDRATDRPTATVHPRWCHIASTVAYLGSLT